MATDSGATATLRITGSNVASQPGCPFWVHGTTGTLRGSVLLDSDRLELDDGSTSTPVELSGAWFVDGFAATMGELMSAVVEDRDPENSAADAARSVAVVPRRPRVRRARRHGRSRSRRERGGRRGAGRRRLRAGLRRGLAELEPGGLVPGRRHRPQAGRGVAAPDAVPARTPVAETGLQAEGLLVVEPGDGEPARLYGTSDLTDIPTMTAELVGERVVVRSTGPVDARTGQDGPTVLAAYGDGLGGRPSAPPRVWCSWYRYFEEVTAADVEENLAAFDQHELPVDVVQVDDGWSPGLGEGLVDVGAVRVASRTGGPDPGHRPARGPVAGAVPGRDADDAGP